MALLFPNARQPTVQFLSVGFNPTVVARLNGEKLLDWCMGGVMQDVACEPGAKLEVEPRGRD